MRMPNIFREVDALRQKGKLHNQLILRTYALFVISIAMGAIVSYNLMFKGTSPVIVVLLAGFGFVLGRFVFTRISVVDWDEDKEVVRIGKMDALGFAVLGAYIGFDIVLRAFLTDLYPGSVTIFLLAVFFGTLFGRAVGMVVEVHRVFRANA
jgi:uncharacterized membrane protein